MACRGFLECLLKLMNFLLALVGLAMVGYGIYLFVEYKKASNATLMLSSLISVGSASVQHKQHLLTAVALDSIFDNLPKAWFIYLFIGIGAIIVIISCFGCIGAVTRSGCCLCFYSVLVILLILIELGCAAFIFFDKSWKSELPTDTTGDFDMIYDFLKENWKIARWVALGAVVLEAVIFFLALMVKASNAPPEYDSDDEIIARQQIRQPLINRPPPPATGVPVSGNHDQRPGRNDAWSARMREKYGLDTSEFTYNPSESNRNQQAASPKAEEKSRCIIM